MEINTVFILNSILLGIGLAMDAFSVSLSNGLNEPNMGKGKTCLIAGTYAVFQYGMPMAGWFLVRTAASFFTVFQIFIPWIALGLLSFLGIKMIVEGIKENKSPEEASGNRLTISALLAQGLATSIDALSVGFTISEYSTSAAFLSGGIIAIVTFSMCVVGVILGRRIGTVLAGKATIIGGVILIGIGLEIFISNMLG